MNQRIRSISFIAPVAEKSGGGGSGVWWGLGVGILCCCIDMDEKSNNTEIKKIKLGRINLVCNFRHF